MRFTGKLKTWTEDRGFGFITPTEGGQDIFLHVSECPMGRRPNLNEMLSFEVALNPQGKKKAVKVRRAETTSAERQDFSGSSRQDSSRLRLSRKPSAGGLLRRIAVLALIVLVGLAGYQRYFGRLPFGNGAPVQGVGGLSRSQAPAASRFSCDGRTRCSQMTSCEEATFFLKNCPGTKMDGDGDGVPCEKQWCK